MWFSLCGTKMDVIKRAQSPSYIDPIDTPEKLSFSERIRSIWSSARMMTIGNAKVAISTSNELTIKHAFPSSKTMEIDLHLQIVVNKEFSSLEKVAIHRTSSNYDLKQ